MNTVQTQNVSSTKKKYPKKAPNSRRMYECPNCKRLIQENNRKKHMIACNRNMNLHSTLDDFIYVANKEEGSGNLIYLDTMNEDIDFLQNLKTQIDEKDDYINELLVELKHEKSRYEQLNKRFRDYQDKVGRMKSVMSSLKKSISG